MSIYNIINDKEEVIINLLESDYNILWERIPIFRLTDIQSRISDIYCGNKEFTHLGILLLLNVIKIMQCNISKEDVYYMLKLVDGLCVELHEKERRKIKRLAYKYDLQDACPSLFYKVELMRIPKIRLNRMANLRFYNMVSHIYYYKHKIFYVYDGNSIYYFDINEDKDYKLVEYNEIVTFVRYYIINNKLYLVIVPNYEYSWYKFENNILSKVSSKSMKWMNKFLLRVPKNMIIYQGPFPAIINNNIVPKFEECNDEELKEWEGKEISIVLYDKLNLINAGRMKILNNRGDIILDDEKSPSIDDNIYTMYVDQIILRRALCSNNDIEYSHLIVYTYV
ncbi:Hypothetical protein ORPV_520 [Orpheovirus IHUMI-LCC2]|uniref:Uncharacterized protein n=1 Tax=Orpheovirus IHUMI-LCC2 TaxID=2023057 RepID=A0A2I2L4G8_9VIRU|nr:Hypothetical protein ORPV_520 [Orpheovirus IHUMI-LCC2]SNW62424.1 Hypothetical protein ORPV_520 [Orpheovirus IHUMI-LCC2]